MTAPTCPGYDELKGLCRAPVLPEVGLCMRCAQLQASRTPQQEREVRWSYGSEGEML